MAAQTPQKEESTVAGKAVDKEWVSEHARQVSKEEISSVPMMTFIQIYGLNVWLSV